jgi:hypothetical protein
MKPSEGISAQIATRVFEDLFREMRSQGLHL